MSFVQSHAFSSIKTENTFIPESNLNGNGFVGAGQGGLFIPPSEVTGRTTVIGYFLTAVSDDGKVEWAENPVTTADLGDLADVDVDTVVDGQTIIYDSANDLWIPGDVASSLALNDLTDVDVSGVTNNQTIVYDAANQLWIPGTGGGGSGTPSLPFNSVQFNNAGDFGGSSNFTYDGTDMTILSGDSIAVNHISTSDVRLKENIKDLDNCLDIIKFMKGKSYTWINKPEDGIQYGVIAQELENIGLGHIVKDKCDGFKGVNYNQLIPILIESIKELNDKLENLLQIK